MIKGIPSASKAFLKAINDKNEELALTYIDFPDFNIQFVLEKNFNEVFKNIYGVLDMILNLLRPSSALRAPSPAKR